MVEEEHLVISKDRKTDEKIMDLRVRLENAYKESIELGIKDFRRGDGEKDVRKHIEKALSNYRWRLMEIMRVQMIENELDKKK
jgi:hypothetical protein